MASAFVSLVSLCALTSQAVILHRRDLMLGPSECPSMFVAVFSRKDDAKRRAVLRKLWVNDASVFDGTGPVDVMYKQAQKQGWPTIQANFAICRGDGEVPKSLQEEEDTYSDLLLLDCDEGYGDGTLTRKTLAAMQAFRDAGFQQQLFMKIDDDTFVARRRLCAAVQQSAPDLRSLETSYMGVVTGGDPEKPAIPHRERSSQFFEPPAVYPNATYPPSMEGGPGYILGRGLLQRVLESGAPQRHMLWVEDKAVGVWVHDVEESGGNVNWVNVAGTDGYSRWRDHGTWGEYPYVLRHHLTEEQVACMTAIAIEDNPNRPVDGCFKGLG
mmetsp:Transcript_126294/g.252327  ORF Transcript_126294/g.252327 Transcript_126294/m.252327 type:complete len:327 (-) Transcript_126294:119-1099(-)